MAQVTGPSTASTAKPTGSGACRNGARVNRHIVHTCHSRAHLSIGSDHMIHLPITFDHKNRAFRALKGSVPHLVVVTLTDPVRRGGRVCGGGGSRRGRRSGV